MSYPQLILDSFNRKMVVFGLTVKTLKNGLTGRPHAFMDLRGDVQHSEYATVTTNPAFEWLENNLGDKWIWQMSSSPTVDNGIIIYFMDEEDAFMFRLSFATISSAPMT